MWCLCLEKSLEWFDLYDLYEHDLSLEFTLHEVFIWETVDKKDLLMVSEHDKEEYNFLLKFILHEVFVTWTVGKTYLLAISENEVKSLTNVLPWTPVEFAK